MANCPISWQNFFHNECHDGPGDTYGDIYTWYIDEKLLPYNAKYIDDKEYIEFDTEANLTLFLLRWS